MLDFACFLGFTVCEWPIEELYALGDYYARSILSADIHRRTIISVCGGRSHIRLDSLSGARTPTETVMASYIRQRIVSGFPRYEIRIEGHWVSAKEASKSLDICLASIYRRIKAVQKAGEVPFELAFVGPIRTLHSCCPQDASTNDNDQSFLDGKLPKLVSRMASIDIPRPRCANPTTHELPILSMIASKRI